MINEITINSNNTIDLSRGDLLLWVNDLLKTNLTKIEQLGTGAIYCQLIDILYPNKLPMSKVNWKAKFDYQFVHNFKILQQTFNNLKILKNIQVERLIKCKYQDNLEFLQWFRKIFQNNGNSSKDYNPLHRRGEEPDKKKEKENRGILNSNHSKDYLRSSSRTHTDLNDRSHLTPCDSFIASERADETIDRSIPCSETKMFSAVPANPPNSPDLNFKAVDVDWKAEAKEESFKEEREFYLKKFKQIEHLCEEWNQSRPSPQLIDNIRKIIMVAPNVDWSVEQGEYRQPNPSSTSIIEETEPEQN